MSVFVHVRNRGRSVCSWALCLWRRHSLCFCFQTSCACLALCPSASVCICCMQVAAAVRVIKALSIDGVDEDGSPAPFSCAEIANAALERHFQVLEVRGWMHCVAVAEGDRLFFVGLCGPSPAAQACRLVPQTAFNTLAAIPPLPTGAGARRGGS